MPQVQCARACAPEVSAQRPSASSAAIAVIDRVLIGRPGKGPLNLVARRTEGVPRTLRPDRLKLSCRPSWNGDGGANAAWRSLQAAEANHFYFPRRECSLKWGERGVGRFSPVRCGRKEAHIVRGVFAFSKM
jgi:hypothetical protein